MKNINKKNKTQIDPMAEARRHPKFNQFAEEAEARIKVSIEICEARRKMGLSQQDLAKKARTTQKVISKIEHGLVNTGIDLLQRITKILDLPLLVGDTCITGKQENYVPKELVKIIFIKSNTDTLDNKIKEANLSYSNINSISLHA